MTEKKRVLNRIKGAIADKDKTNKWLAEKIGVNPNTVSRWCRNDIQPSLETLFDIAEALEVSVSELLVSNM